MVGCAETPRRPVLRPIPPPPASPPPGAVYSPAPTPAPNASAAQTPAVTLTNAPGTQSGYEVTTNFAPNATIQNAPGSDVVGSVTPDTGVPQYEVVPERPGIDYDWVDGYWAWQGRWVWVPGRWVWRPQPRVIVSPEFYWGPRYYYGPRYYHGWRHGPGRWR